MRCGILVLVASLMVISAPTRADDGRAVVIVGHWPPWEFVDETTGRISGPAVELTRAIFQRMNVETDFRVVPWQRALPWINEGSADLIPMITRSEDRDPYMLFSDPLYQDRLVLVTRAGPDAKANCAWKRKGLRGKTIGLTREYDYTPRWARRMKDRRFKVALANTDLAHLKQAATGRVDLSLQYHSFLRSEQVRNTVDPEQLRVCRPPVDRPVFRFGISRQSPLAARLEEFNRTLRSLKADGTYEALLGPLSRDSDPVLETASRETESIPE